MRDARRAAHLVALALVCALALAACKRNRAPSTKGASGETAPERDMICLEYPDGCVFCVGREADSTFISPEQARPLACDPDEPDSCVEFCSATTAQCALPWSKSPACVFESSEAFQRARFSRDSSDKPVASLVLRILDEAGKRLDGASARVWVAYRGQLTRLMDERAGKDGVLRLRLPKASGEYVLRVGAPGRAAEFISGLQPDKLDTKAGGPTSRSVHLKPESTLRGVVTDAVTGAPLPGAAIAAVRSPSDVLSAGDTTSGEDGAFVLHDLETRSYFLRVVKFGWKPFFSKAASAAPSGRVQVKLTQVIALEGTVRDQDGDPVSNATVVALASGAPNDRAAPIYWTTDADGRFAEDNFFSVGTYYVWARRRDLLTFPPEKVELGAGEHAELDLRLQHKGARVLGEVGDEAGRPLAEGARVELFGRSPLVFPRAAVAELRGHSFVVSGLLPGRYAISVTDGVRRVLVERGPKEVEIPIDPGASIKLSAPLVVRPQKSE